MRTVHLSEENFGWRYVCFCKWHDGCDAYMWLFLKWESVWQQSIQAHEYLYNVHEHTQYTDTHYHHIENVFCLNIT